MRPCKWFCSIAPYNFFSPVAPHDINTTFDDDDDNAAATDGGHYG